MPISQEAIDRFLAHVQELPPDFKSESDAYLTDFIYDLTGEQFSPKTPPRPRQLAGLAFGLWVKRGLLYYEQRTGKTWISLNWLAHLKRCRRMQQALIIAHAPIGIDVWEGQAALHSNLNIISIRTSSTAHEEFFAALGQYDAIVTTWSTLQSIFTEKRLSRKKVPKLYSNKELLAEAAQYIDTMVIDEIHKSMNPDSLRFEIAAGLIANCEWRLGLTGTPFGRNPYGLWAQAYLIDDGLTLGHNYFFFEAAFGKKQYTPFSRLKYEYVFDQDKMPILRDKMQAITIFCQLTDVQEVNVLSGVINLKMSAAQNNAYKGIIKELYSLNTGETQKIQNTFVRLRQIASGYLPFIDPNTGEETVIEFRDASKFIWLEDFLQELDDAVKCVFFHEFTATGRRICDILRKLKIKHGWLYGKTKDRGAVLRGFQQGEFSVLVANTETGGTGVDLSMADYVNFFECPTSGITRKQAAARPLARGSKPLVIDDLICAPVEDRILGFVAQGQTLIEQLRDPKALAQALST